MRREIIIRQDWRETAVKENTKEEKEVKDEKTENTENSKGKY